ncbi:astacin [Ancylostoma ceylanicum]|uniref:Metalloendopeptidase n=1 Tax=Ancylostoma ceylanicum TaxID=53326 RepID=A0A0D6LEP6_9BILA|nr:astacin [Ancylostoma ceylanicum]
MFSSALFWSQLIESSEDKPSEATRWKRHAFKYPKNTWTEGVNYYFDPQPSKEFKDTFARAVRAWEQDTCIEFKEDPTAADKIRIKTNERGCASNVGRVGGEQLMYLGKGCETFDNMVHELGHSLGLLHMMNRHDRDEYITVHEWNIKPPDNCGKELSASTEWKPLTDMMMYVNAEDFIDGYDKCNYWIKSANNTFIAVKIKSLRPAGPVRNGCVEAGVEIKAQKNQVLTGYRYNSSIKP